MMTSSMRGASGEPKMFSRLLVRPRARKNAGNVSAPAEAGTEEVNTIDVDSSPLQRRLHFKTLNFVLTLPQTVVAIREGQ